MVSRKLYVEGGGDSKSLRSVCRRGFRRFLEKAGVRRRPRIVACGSRENTYDSFRTACEKEEEALLLVDAEGPVGTADSWKHLQSQDGWERPPNVGNDRCHLRVQVLESWFLADPDALADFYEQDFHRKSLPANPRIEKISKERVLQGLEKASRRTRKGRYDKGRDSFDLVGELDPNRVEKASPHAKRFLDRLRAVTP